LLWRRERRQGLEGAVNRRTKRGGVPLDGIGLKETRVGGGGTPLKKRRGGKSKKSQPKERWIGH